MSLTTHAPSGFLFFAKTNEGHIIKTLIECLQQTIKDACFQLTSEGIFHRMMDSHKKLLNNIELRADKFHEFECPEDLVIGLNLIHLYRILKSVKKKDHITLYIDREEPNTLHIVFQPPDNSRRSRNTIQIKSIQNVSSPLPGPYPHPVIISSADYQSNLKDIAIHGNLLRVQIRKHMFEFSAVTENVTTKSVELGVVGDTAPVCYDECFEMDYFNRTIKISGLSKKLQVYAGSDRLPFHIQADVGGLGFISIYLKSNPQKRAG